jgi:flagellum-specific ATP synthase
VIGEVVGFEKQQTIVMPLGATTGIQCGDRVVAEQCVQTVNVGSALLGRVLDGLGRPIDDKGPLRDTVRRPLTPRTIDPLDRPLIDEPLATGVRAIDAMCSVGRGQRLGVFAAPGLGKSTLLAQMARNTAADVSVIALVGERGREVRDFIDNHLGDVGLARSVVVCATGDEPALLRIRAAMVGLSIAEYFRDQGNDVLMIMDSITRFCQAQRQVGLAAGEPPATRGYPPSVFAMLPTLLERGGRTQHGSITGLYAVLVEGDDLNEPISDAARGVLDGHIVLSQKLANRGHWPAIDVLSSISRVANDVTDKGHQEARREVLRLMGAYEEIEDLLNIGAYAQGNNPQADLAIACKPAIDQLLQQGQHETTQGDFGRTRGQLLALQKHIETQRAQMGRPHQRGVSGPQASRQAVAGQPARAAGR